MPRASKIAAKAAAAKAAPKAPAPAPEVKSPEARDGVSSKRTPRRPSNVKPAKPEPVEPAKPAPAKTAPVEPEPVPERDSVSPAPAEPGCTGFAPAFAELASSVPSSVRAKVLSRLEKKGINPADADLCPLDSKAVLDALEHAVEVYKRKRSRAREAAAQKREAAKATTAPDPAPEEA